LADAPGAEFSVALNTEQFDADNIGEYILLRHWQPGDRFRPIGLGAARKLQDVFTDLKTPKAERRRRVVAATSAGEIFWVQGLRMGDIGKLKRSTRRRLVWRWKEA
jgi:tRNA(Ile)-lysidine synthase